MRKVMRAIKLAEYGGDELTISIIACGAVAIGLSLIHPLLSTLPLIPLAIIVYFFRDPERVIPVETDILVSPADGTVTDIQELDETEFLGERAIRIGIFLSPFNVHVNRVPCSGRVSYACYRQGEFLPAYNPAAPTRNESMTIGLEAETGLRLMVKQITGILARRIVCEAHTGDTFARGQRYGMIKFGSRTELYIPLSANPRVLVKLRDKVVGGETICCGYAVAASGSEVVVEKPQYGAVERKPA